MDIDKSAYKEDIRAAMENLRQCGVVFPSVEAQDGAHEVLHDLIAETHEDARSDGYSEGYDEGYEAGCGNGQSW